MADREDRIREEAYQIWLSEGRPEGRAEVHWAEAKEIIALKDGALQSSLQDPSDTAEENAEPALAHEKLGQVPNLDDSGRGISGPTRQAAVDQAEVKPLSTKRKPKRESKSSGA